jgi:hypothetical protein
MRATGRKISLAIGAMLAGVAVVPVSADALLPAEWNGNIKGDPDSFISFNVARTDQGVKRVRDVVLGGLDMTCEDGSGGEANGVSLLRRFRVRQGEFGGKTDSVISGFDPPAKIKGKLRPGQRAVGTFRVRGELDPIGRPGVNCRTGLQEWKATKGPPPG